MNAEVEEFAGPRGIRECAVPRVEVRHFGGNRSAEILAESFVTHEIKQRVAANRSAQRQPELVAREWRLAGSVEIIFRIEGIVAMELISGSAQRVASRLGD